MVPAECHRKLHEIPKEGAEFRAGAFSFFMRKVTQQTASVSCRDARRRIRRWFLNMPRCNSAGFGASLGRGLRRPGYTQMSSDGSLCSHRLQTAVVWYGAGFYIRSVCRSSCLLFACTCLSSGRGCWEEHNPQVWSNKLSNT